MSKPSRINEPALIGDEIYIRSTILAQQILVGGYVTPSEWDNLEIDKIENRIRKAVQHGHLIPSGKVGNYNVFTPAAIQQWVNDGCQYASKRVNEEAE